MNCRKDGAWYVAGHASWTIVTCEGFPAVYTRESYFWEWIQFQMTLNQRPPVAAASEE